MPRRGFQSRHADPMMMAIPSESDEEIEEEHIDDDDEEEEEEFDLIEVLNEMTLHERRKIYALKGLHDEYLAVRRRLREELNQLQLTHHNMLAKMFEKRRQIVNGECDVTKEEIANVNKADDNDDSNNDNKKTLSDNEQQQQQEQQQHDDDTIAETKPKDTDEQQEQQKPEDEDNNNEESNEKKQDNVKNEQHDELNNKDGVETSTKLTTSDENDKAKDENEQDDKKDTKVKDQSEQSKEKKQRKGVKIVDPTDERAAAAISNAADDVHGGIPDFWLTALRNTEVFDSLITERDRKALHYLQNVSTEYIDSNPAKGVIITFTFAPNEYFTNTTLTKTYHMEANEDDDENEIAKIEGCTIN